MHYINVYFNVNDMNSVAIAIPGLNDVVDIPFKAANTFIRENWGHQYQLLRVGSDFNGSIASDVLYWFLIKNKIEINDYIEADYPIMDEDDFDNFLVTIREIEDE